MYKYDISSVSKPFKQEDLQEGRLNLCIFFANTSLDIPFIQYILYKYNEGDLKDNMIIPFIEYNKNHSLDNQLRVFFSKIFTESIEGQQIELKGLLDENYLFIDISYFLQTFKDKLAIFKEYKDNWWFVTLSEIINNKHVYDIVIHSSVTSLFSNNEPLLTITYKKEPVENPIVVYNGYSYNRCLYVSIFGKNKSFSNAYYGTYYYYTDYEGANHFALDKEKSKDIKHGIVRSILFIKKSKVVLNSSNDEKTDLFLYDHLTEQEKHAYSRIYNPYGDWGKLYDTLFIYKPVLNDGKTLQQQLNVVSVNSNNGIVLDWIVL